MDQLTSSAAEPRGVDAGRGLAWWTEAWALFTKNAGIWIVLALILMVIFVVLALIPLLGSLAASLLAPVFIGSLMMTARKAQSGAAIEVGDLFAAFKDKLNPLLVVGALLLVATIVIVFIVGALGFGAVMGMMAGGTRHSAGGVMAAAGAGMLALIVCVALGALTTMWLWFAPALIVFRGVAPVDAMKASFAAGLKNVVPFLLFGVIYFAAAIVASIPFGLGWIVLIPVSLLTMYVSYEDVFGV